MGLFPNYLWIDLEASSLSVKSWPCEFGWTGADLKSQSFLIRPMKQWGDWSLASESMHGILPQELRDHGIDAADAARRINELSSGKQMLSDNPEMDGTWLKQLFHDTGVKQTFSLHDSRQLEKAAAALSKLTPDRAQSMTEQINQAFPHPHRAAPDARRGAARFLALALPHGIDDILAMV